MPALAIFLRGVFALGVAAITSFAGLFVTLVLFYLCFDVVQGQAHVEPPNALHMVMAFASLMVGTAAGPVTGTSMMPIPYRRVSGMSLSVIYTLATIYLIARPQGIAAQSEYIAIVAGAVSGTGLSWLSVLLRFPSSVFPTTSSPVSLPPPERLATGAKTFGQRRSEIDDKNPGETYQASDTAPVPFIIYLRSHPILQSLVALAMLACIIGAIFSVFVPKALAPAHDLTCAILVIPHRGNNDVWRYTTCGWSYLIWSLEAGAWFGVFPTIVFRSVRRWLQ